MIKFGKLKKWNKWTGKIWIKFSGYYNSDCQPSDRMK